MVTLCQEETRRAASDIGDVAAIAGSTVKQAYRTIYPYRMELVPKTYAEPIVVDQLPGS